MPGGEIRRPERERDVRRVADRRLGGSGRLGEPAEVGERLDRPVADVGQVVHRARWVAEHEIDVHRAVVAAEGLERRLERDRLAVDGRRTGRHDLERGQVDHEDDRVGVVDVEQADQVLGADVLGRQAGQAGRRDAGRRILVGVDVDLADGLVDRGPGGEVDRHRHHALAVGPAADDRRVDGAAAVARRVVDDRSERAGRQDVGRHDRGRQRSTDQRLVPAGPVDHRMGERRELGKLDAEVTLAGAPVEWRRARVGDVHDRARRRAEVDRRRDGLRIDRRDGCGKAEVAGLVGAVGDGDVGEPVDVAAR